jgi:hypothetical protein
MGGWFQMKTNHQPSPSSVSPKAKSTLLGRCVMHLGEPRPAIFPIEQIEQRCHDRTLLSDHSARVARLKSKNF